MPHLRVQLGFTSANDHTLEEIAGSVHDNLFGTPAYPTPPVTQDTLQTALTDFSASLAAQLQGGTAATADKNSKRDALITLLRQLASYVQERCGNDLATLLASGFDAVSMNRASTQLAQPLIKELINGLSGQLRVRIGPIPNARCFEIRYALIGPGGAPGPGQSAGLITNSRALSIEGLTPGANYTVQVRAIGGSTGYSDWSDPVSHMSL